MHSDHQVFPQNTTPLGNLVGRPVLPPGVMHSCPFNGIKVQSSELCPKNYVIFDQTDQRSQIMFHPTVAPKLGYPCLDIRASYIQDNIEGQYGHYEEGETGTWKEDSDDIDALLSFEDDEQDVFDEEEVSTGRTYGDYECDSADSGSTYGSKPRKSRLNSLQNSSGSVNSEKKRLKLRKMVKALRGIVPGGNQMNTVAVLDEAVKYLKSLKVEVQRIEVTNLKN